MVQAARVRLKPIANTSVEKANCFDLPFQAHTFDTVFLANLLHIIPNPEKAVLESHRVLRPRGKIIVTSFTSEGMTLFSKLGMGYRYLRTWGKPPAAGTTLTVQKTRSMLEECGFTVEAATLIGSKSKAVFATALVF
jgi:ABC-2 type transport system ATP-binding protein